MAPVSWNPLSTMTGLLTAWIALMAAYLLTLSVAALLGHPPPPPGPARRRFAVLIPAHDEATVIRRLLSSLRAQRYPTHLFAVFVVADNCTDDTAALAREAGATVLERHEPALAAKGHALAWLLGRVRAAGPVDAYVVLDADSVVESDLLSRFDARMEAGSRVIQAQYRVLNPGASSVTALRDAALASLHFLRPAGRTRLGLSCGLKGNGMCFEASLLDRFGWPSAGLAEDVEFHLLLVGAGLRVDFAPEVLVRADMPVTLAGSRTQHLRWETGRLRSLRQAIPLLARGIVNRDPIAADAALEQFVPPLSVAVVVGAGCALAQFLLGAPQLAFTAAAATAGLAIHVVAGLVAVHAPRRAYLALLGAPPYIAWKVWLYARSVLTPSKQPWVRTDRSGR